MNEELLKKLQQIERFFSQNRQDEAQAAVEKMENTIKDQEDPEYTWIEHYLKGVVYSTNQDPEEAIKSFNFSLQVAIGNKLRFQEAKSQLTLGKIAFQYGDLDDASQLQNQAIDKFKLLKRNEVINAQTALAKTLISQEKNEEADEIVQEAMENAKNAQDFEAIAEILQIIGYLEQKKGLYRDSLKSLRDSISLYKDTDNKTLIGDSYLRLVKVLMEKGDYVQALEIISQAINLFNEMNQDLNIVKASHLAGWCHFHINDLEGSIRNFHEAITIYNTKIKTQDMVLSNLQVGIFCTHIRKNEFVVANRKLEELTQINKFLILPELSRLINDIQGVLLFKQAKYSESQNFFSDERIESEPNDFTKVRLMLYKLWLLIMERKETKKDLPDEKPTLEMNQLIEKIYVLVKKKNAYSLITRVEKLRAFIIAYALKNVMALEIMQKAEKDSTKYDFKTLFYKCQEEKKPIERAIQDLISFSMFDKASVVEYQDKILKLIESSLDEITQHTNILPLIR